MEEESLRDQLARLQADLQVRFQELREDNQNMKVRLRKIELKLGSNTEGEVTGSEVGEKEREVEVAVDNEEQTDDQLEAKDNDDTPAAIEKEFEENFSDEEEESEEDEIETNDEEHVKEVKLEKIARSVYQGFCFRPIAGWKNSEGKFEISKEFVEIDEEGVELKICGFESNEEIAKIIIPLRDVDKAEVVHSEKTILFLHVGVEICEAAEQCLSMTNITSFSLVDKDSARIRICFEAISDQRRALLREYFRRRAIYFKTVGDSDKERIFFKKMRRDLPPKYDSNKPQPLEDFVKTVKSVKFLDRVTYRCKVCDYYNQTKSVVLGHVTRFHLGDKRSGPDKS